MRYDESRFSFHSAINALHFWCEKITYATLETETRWGWPKTVHWAICWPKSSGDSVGFVSQLCCVQALPCVCQASRDWCLAFPPCLPPSPSGFFAGTGALDFSFWNNWGLKFLSWVFFKISNEKNKKAVSKTKPFMLGAKEMFPLFSLSPLPLLFSNLIMV